MNNDQQKLTLDRPLTYQIKVPGVLDEMWSDWGGMVRVSFEEETDNQMVTMLTVAVDQAALHGLLRRLYSLGLPLISVQCIEIP